MGMPKKYYPVHKAREILDKATETPSDSGKVSVPVQALITVLDELERVYDEVASMSYF